MNQQPSEKRVLVVEDDEATLKALRAELEKEGVAVLEARNGVEGLTMALAEHPDLILLDILMPMMDGWEMLKQVREKDSWGKCVPVAVLTNLSSDEDEQIRNIAELGPSFFMVKADWKLEGVVNKVMEILNTEKIACP
ncbi:MAG: response regulator [Minisyncoccota bacterium]